MKECDEITYLDTPGLADVKLRQTAAKAITEALKQNGIYQIFFVLTLSSGKVRSEDLVTIWLVLMHAGNIKSYIILVNKLSKQEHIHFETIKKEIINSVTKLDPQEERQTPYILPLLFDDTLNDVENEFKKFENMNEFIAKVPWVNVNPDSVNEIQYDDHSFKQTVPDFMNHATRSLTTSKQIWKGKKGKDLKVWKYGVKFGLSLLVTFLFLIWFLGYYIGLLYLAVGFCYAFNCRRGYLQV